MALSTRNGKRRQFEDGVGPFEKRKRSCSRVSEPKRNVAVEEKPTACLPLRKSSSPKQCKKIFPLASLLESLDNPRRNWVLMVSVRPRRARGKNWVLTAKRRCIVLKLIFSNAFRYYPLGRKERAAAKHLNGAFETKWKEAVDKKSKAVCPSALPKVEGLSPKLKQGKSSSPSAVNLQSQGLGVSHSTKDDDLATLVQHAMDQASENLSPFRASRIQLLKLQFSDTILKANKTLKRLPDSPPREKLMQRMKQRKLPRRAILNVEKSVQFEYPLQDLKQLEMLCGCGSGDTFLQVHLGLPLKKLGLYLKEDDELQGQDEETFLNGDWEEGEIHS
ncbi:hypothetical protein L3X38_018043 [Prunus dulcis]|uniref:Uncharacterized protein n=1 Tax=Prunus dulcis TaxID=3755 RepID=A0AAD4W912_PRUDU|nr:hypothetical protein L3X38_018043 [Prunus dulcis]